MGPAASEDVEPRETIQVTQINERIPNENEDRANAKGAPKPTPKGKGGTKEVQADQSTSNDGKLSGKELKQKKQAEKAARREKERQDRQGQPVTDMKGGKAAQQDRVKKTQAPGSAPPPQTKPHHRRKSSAAAHAPKVLPLRPIDSEATSKGREPKVEDKRVALFEHLYGQPRRHTIAGASKDIHPSVLALGLQISSYEVCGSNARCVFTLLVLKEVITAYSTPIGNSLPRHLTTHLASQIDYLVSCRPLSVSQGNAIRWLKVKISAVDVSTPEDQAKNDLCAAIDGFIDERIVVADEVIAASACERIKTGDVILTYGKSSIVEKTLIAAHKQEKRFKVVVVDSRPLFEGKNLAKALVGLGVEVQYSLLTGLSHVAPKATKCLLGAHAMMANGRLYSRAGTAMVAMMAKDSNMPVMVCCESVKLTERVALDSFVHNELAPEDELIPPTSDGSEHVLAKWRDVPNLQLLNMMYDLTPAEFIDIVITEHGNMPPQSVMAVQRLSTNT